MTYVSRNTQNVWQPSRDLLAQKAAELHDPEKRKQQIVKLIQDGQIDGAKNAIKLAGHAGVITPAEQAELEGAVAQLERVTPPGASSPTASPEVQEAARRAAD